MVHTIYTIGTQGMKDDVFIALLKKHEVDAVIDIRLRNEGRYYRFASGKHIAALMEAHGIAYRHDTRFAPTAEMLGRFKTDHDWSAYEQAYRTLINQLDMARLWREMTSQFVRPCLLCAEKTANQCHRRLLGEHLAGANNTALSHITL